VTGRVSWAIDDGVARLTLDNPTKLNALDFVMYEQLLSACAGLGERGDVRVVVVRGAGDRAFASGTDIAEFRSFLDLDRDARGRAGVDYEARTAGVLDALSRLPMPVIAAVRGPAVGAGLAIALMCDLVVAAEDAVFGAPVARTLGNCLSPLVIGALYAAIGRARARAVLMTGALLPAKEAAGYGLVSQCVPASSFDARVEQVVASVRRLAPQSLRAFRAVDRRLMGTARELAADDLYESCYAGRDFEHGVTAFLAKTEPPWTA
jgi:enoyl-CoA hydratase